MSRKYNSSEQLAYDLGYRARYDSNAHNGRYFFKRGKIWIHDIEALKSRLGVSYDYELEELSYDVDAYYKYND